MISEIDENRSTRVKTGGRHKGTPNRVTTDVRQAFADLVRGNLENVQTWLDRVAADDPAKALELLLQLSRYVLPELKAVAVDIRPSRPLCSLSAEDLRGLSYDELQRIAYEESGVNLRELSMGEMRRIANEESEPARLPHQAPETPISSGTSGS